MPSCPKCGKLNTDDAIYCTNCGASLSDTSQPAMSEPFQPEAPVSTPPSPATSAGIPSSVSTGQLSERLQKALRRAELLSYAAIGLSVIVLLVIIYIVYG